MFIMLATIGILATTSLAQAAPPKTFGKGVPNFPVTASEEREIFAYTLSAGASYGTLNHFWSTACGGATPAWDGPFSGAAIYRYYVDGESMPSIQFQPRMVAGTGFFPKMAMSSPDPWATPWGTEWLGKTSDMDGFFNNMPVPFGRSIRITVQLPTGVPGFNVYTIVRGVENVPVHFGGFELPPSSRLVLQRRDSVHVPSLDYFAIANVTQGDGMVFAHVLAFQGNAGFTFLEGCFHLLTPYSQPFPGTVLSTGMEDYYDSSFYFHAGLFQQPVSGVTHMCSPQAGKVLRPGMTASLSAAHPKCASQTNVSEWSAYRVHNQDPLFFRSGVQLLVRNGDVPAPIPGPAGYTGKCFNQDRPANAGPGESLVSSYAWIYTWPSEVPKSQSRVDAMLV